MRPDLHLHPDRLFAHAAVAAGLSEELHAALRGGPADEGDEPERLRTAIGAAVRELAELSAVLSGAAAGAAAADAEVRRSVGRVGPDGT